ncbi:uncharacterized protein PgNI_03595 [Pyricularia grisea]|uniref:Uncharacterized protein n=1 Tax=Pyricularia grisea TaxID=148305 RepID=A0A6P8BAT1_PYRGI|nr:uncharacterized protein PgNI_03595 [Pyricularia grisea]TLD12935.1 hypothetical protein PgNI_03595 [Pyricularia grisea]
MGPEGRGYMCYVSIGVAFPKRPGTYAIQTQWGIDTQPETPFEGISLNGLLSLPVSVVSSFWLLGKLAGSYKPKQTE